MSSAAPLPDRSRYDEMVEAATLEIEHAQHPRVFARSQGDPRGKEILLAVNRHVTVAALDAAGVPALLAAAEAAEKLWALLIRRDQMIANDTWESEGAIPTYKALANAEKRLATALSHLPWHREEGSNDAG